MLPDALLLTATEDCPKKSKSWGLASHFILTILSVFGHALVILLQGTTLSVAINANNRALLTVMMSNNFVELKGAVFKKFDKINLFQVKGTTKELKYWLKTFYSLTYYYVWLAIRFLAVMSENDSIFSSFCWSCVFKQ